LITELRRVEYLRESAIELAQDASEEPDRFVGTSRLDEPVGMVAERALRLLDLPMPRRQEWRDEYDALNAWRDAMERQGVLVMHLNHVDVGRSAGSPSPGSPFP